MKIRPLLIPLAVVSAFGGAVAWLVLAEPPPLPEEPASSPAPAQAESWPEAPPLPAAKTPEPTRTETQQTAAPAAPVPDDIRNVSPEGVTAPQVTGELTRIAPSERFLELMNPPAIPVPDGPMELVQVEVPDSGHLKSGPLTVKLAQIDALPLEATCKTALGASWPCGTRARTFLRGLIRRFKVSCTKGEEVGPQMVLARCSRGSIDLGTQLVRFGWAAAAADAPDELQQLSKAAREKKIGQWQTEWLTDLPSSDWAGTETPLEPEQLAPDVIDWSLRTDLSDPTRLLEAPGPQADPLGAPLPAQ